MIVQGFCCVEKELLVKSQDAGGVRTVANPDDYIFVFGSGEGQVDGIVMGDID